MNVKITYKAGLLMGLMFLLTGCSAASDAGQTASEESTSSSASSSFSDDQASEKMQYYVDCINKFSNNVFNSQEQYLRNVNPETGPTGEESYVGINPIYQDPEICITGVQTANAIQAEAQLNAPATAYAEALKVLASLMEEANEYYEMENYKDDAFAKGKEMHGPLMAAFAQFDQSDLALRAEMDKVQKVLDENLLKELKESGDKFGYLHKKLIMDAEALVDLANVPTFNDVDLEAYNAALATYEAILNELNAYEESNEEETKAVLFYSSLDSAAESFLKAAKELMRRKRDNTPYDTGEQMLGGDHSELVSGSPSQVIDKYNGLIDASNRLRY